MKSGYIELRELPENRRIKTIHLTEKGQEYADSLIPHIHQADCKAMSALTEEQQAYTLADRIIVGRFVGDTAFSAIGATNALSMTFMSMCMGAAIGTGVVVSQYLQDAGWVHCCI